MTIDSPGVYAGLDEPVAGGVAGVELHLDGVAADADHGCGLLGCAEHCVRVDSVGEVECRRHAVTSIMRATSWWADACSAVLVANGMVMGVGGTVTLNRCCA